MKTGIAQNTFHGEAEPAWSITLIRLGLIGTGVVVLQAAAAIWGLGEAFWQPRSIAFSILAWIFGMTCFVLAMLTRVPYRAQWLILVGLIFAWWGSAYIEQLNYSPLAVSHTDNEMIGEFAVEALKNGYNPYRWNFSDITRVFRDKGLYVTTFLDGTSQNRLTYPALPILTFSAFNIVGLKSTRSISLIFQTLMLVLLYLGVPIRLRPIALLPLFVARAYFRISIGGIQDIVWSTLLVAMILALKRPTLRAVLFGLACAYRQQPWLVAPFLLIYLWNESTDANQEKQYRPHSSITDFLRHARFVITDPRVRNVLYFSTVSFGVFLLINLPFMLWDLQAWALGVFEPLYAAFNIHSHGLGALTQYNLVPLPRVFYTSLQLSSLVIMLVIHWRHPRSVGQAFWIFPGIFFFLYYRGLINYWLYWIPPLLIAIVRTRSQAPILTEPSARWRWTTILVFAVLTGNLIWGVLLLQRQPAIGVSLHYPIEFPVSRLGLTVNNTTDQMLRPRFAVQPGGNQPLPWDIVKGPERLNPGEIGNFIIQAPSIAYAFPSARGAQVVLSDASNDYDLRAVINVPGDATFNNPDAIINPSFTFWWSSTQSPARWSWSVSEGEVIPPRLEMIDGRLALLLSIESGVGQLSQRITFPDTFSIWVRPTKFTDVLFQAPYGLELDDGQHRLWVLFSDRDGSSQPTKDFGVVYTLVPANQWSLQTIDPADLYARFGWELPAYSLRNRQGIEFASRQVTLSLLVSGINLSQVFGPLEQDPGFASPKELVAETIEHPDIYYVNMGNEYCRQRNLDLAIAAYKRALEFNSENTYARQGLETCR